MIDSPRQERADRRRDLVRAAYLRIAGGGFEGLRTREVAADAGVNIATLHYYFPSKEALIRGVVGHAMQRFGTTLSGSGTPAEQLRAHLRGVRRLLRDEPELFSVMGELALRSVRDPAIARVFGGTRDAWHAMLRSLVGQGVREGSLDPGLDPDETAALVVAALAGACMMPAGADERVDQAFRQLERWLRLDGDGADDGAGR